MRNRRKKKTNYLWNRLLVVTVFALVVPVSLNLVKGYGSKIGQIGEQAAMLAASANMPEEGLDQLKDRFREDLYLEHIPGGEDYDTHGEAEPEGSSWPRPASPPPQQQEPEPDMQDSGDPARATRPPTIPEEYRARIVSENFANSTSIALVEFQGGYIKNDSNMSNDTVSQILETPLELVFENTGEPQVLIVHTHATEAFERYDSEYYDTRNTWRSQDNNMNMVAVGAAMAGVLEEAGIGVLHDTTQHDYPSYNGSYERSAMTIKKYLEEYPSIKVVLDLHRDAMERDNQTIVKPVTEIGGKKAAQIMIIAAADDAGTLGVPQYKSNLRFAATLQSYLANAYTDLTRPVFFCYRKYNQDLTTGSLLIEFGSNANTLEEAVYSGELVGQALVDLIYDYME